MNDDRNRKARDTAPAPLDERAHEARSRQVLDALCHGCDADDQLDDDAHDGVPEDPEEYDPRGYGLAATAHALADVLEQHMAIGGDPARLTDAIFPEGLPTPNRAVPDPALADLDTARIARMSRQQLETAAGRVRGGSRVLDLPGMTDEQVRDLVTDELRSLRSPS